jgi:hypothetical protein
MPVRLWLRFQESVVFHLFDLFNSATYEQWLYLYLRLCFKIILEAASLRVFAEKQEFCLLPKSNRENSEASA